MRFRVHLAFGVAALGVCACAVAACEAFSGTEAEKDAAQTDASDGATADGATTDSSSADGSLFGDTAIADGGPDACNGAAGFGANFNTASPFQLLMDAGGAVEVENGQLVASFNVAGAQSGIRAIAVGSQAMPLGIERIHLEYMLKADALPAQTEGALGCSVAFSMGTAPPFIAVSFVSVGNELRLLQSPVGGGTSFQVLQGQRPGELSLVALDVRMTNVAGTEGTATMTFGAMTVAPLDKIAFSQRPTGVTVACGIPQANVNGSSPTSYSLRVDDVSLTVCAP